MYCMYLTFQYADYKKYSNIMLKSVFRHTE